MVFTDGGEALTYGVGGLIRGTTERSLTPSALCSYSEKAAMHEPAICWHHDLRFLSLQNCVKQISVVSEPLSLWTSEWTKRVVCPGDSCKSQIGTKERERERKERR